MNRKKYIMSYNWWLDEEETWFIDALNNVLFCMIENIVHFISELPDDSNGSHLRCVKIQEKVFCMPSGAKEIYCYNIKKGIWKKIQIKSPNSMKCSIGRFYIYNNNIFLISNQLKQIIELNPLTEEVEEYYYIPVDSNDALGMATFVRQCIYIVSPNLSKVFEFNCMTKKIQTYYLPIYGDKVYTICFDEQSFWLSGQEKNIYVWDRECAVVRRVENLQIDYKGMERNFSESIYVGGYIWFISRITNKIFYFNKETSKMSEFVVEDEIENEGLLKGTNKLRYILEYIYDDRYIGLYSLNSYQMIEIDVLKLNYRILEYAIDLKSKKIIKGIQLNNLLLGRRNYENFEMNIENLITYITDERDELYTQENITTRIGSWIYKSLEFENIRGKEYG